jgi:hypothetical protein
MSKGHADSGDQVTLIDGNLKRELLRHGRFIGIVIKKSWVRAISALTSSLLVALEDGRSASESLDVFYWLYKLTIQNGIFGRKPASGKSLSFVLSPSIRV